MESRVPQISTRKGAHSHRDCDGKLDEAAQEELKAKALAQIEPSRFNQRLKEKRSSKGNSRVAGNPEVCTWTRSRLIG
jgi:hypothetical protein